MERGGSLSPEAQGAPPLFWRGGFQGGVGVPRGFGTAGGPGWGNLGVRGGFGCYGGGGAVG